MRNTLLLLLLILLIPCLVAAEEAGNTESENSPPKALAPGVSPIYPGQENSTAWPYPCDIADPECFDYIFNNMPDESVENLKELGKEYRLRKIQREKSLENRRKNRVPPERFEIRGTFDNDIFILNAAGGDRGYTNGFHTQALWRLDTDPNSYIDQWRDPIQNPVKSWFLALFDSDAGKGIPRVGFSAGQSIYTPEDIKDPQIIEDDRPYAGWLYLGGIFELKGPASGLHLELQVGTTGDWSLAEPTQKAVHKFTTSPYPRGWDHQISSGVGLNLIGITNHLLFDIEAPIRRGVAVQLADSQIYSRTNLGTFMNAQAVGLELRFGFIKALWMKPIEPGETIPDRHVPARLSVRGFDMTQGYLYVRLENALVLYNATIQGLPFQRSPQTLNIMPMVQQGEWGVMLQPINFFDIQLSVVHRTQETRKGDQDFGGHSWGHLNFGFHWY